MADDRSVEVEIEIDGVALRGHLARPPGVGRVPGLVLCHGFPHGPGGAATVGGTYPALADWLASQTGWAVLTFNFRGTGSSGGDFSMNGWLADLDAAVGHLAARSDVTGVWVVGTATGGSVCLVHAARDERVRGVATLAAPASLRHWVDNVPRFLEHARRLGVIRTEGFPDDVVAWSREIADLDPLAASAKIPPRPLLVLHGADDEVVSPADSEAIARAAGPETEHRLLAGASHRLRHDPRVVALLAGWMSRQER
ncbi:MAG TPA: alpha/beta fold hydrolase [Acidimicrobiia bacterium]|nr:alpha/beta fold hydrolase [Acidimicrobiia bacterium]